MSKLNPKAEAAARKQAMRVLFETGISLQEARPLLLHFYRNAESLAPCCNNLADEIIIIHLRALSQSLGCMELAMRRGRQWGHEDYEKKARG